MAISLEESAQEPRITAFMSQDPAMIKAYQEGKDLYSVIASMSFDVPYEDCLEFYPEGKEVVIGGNKIVCGYKNVKNEDGKERRTQAKSVLLGLEYGRGAKSIGEQIGKTKEQAQEIINRFFKAFPSVKDWIEKVHKHCKKTGQVEDWYGRIRHLPEMMLPDYNIESIDKKKINGDFNPFLMCENRIDKELQNTMKKYSDRLSNTFRFDDINRIITEAKYKGIGIRSNSNLKATAERESVNSIIQGGAATLTKVAMINIDNDEELNRLGYHLQIPIHDEVLGECPAENADIVAERLAEVMVGSVKPYMNVPMSCDIYNVKNWYDDELYAVILDVYEKMMKKSDDKEKVIDEVCNKYSYIDRDIIEGVCRGTIKSL